MPVAGCRSPTKAFEAIEQLPPRLDTTLLFPAPMGGHLEIRNWRSRNWYPALEAAGVTQRGPYHLRHTFATEALAAGVSTFELSRVMGTSLGMIDRHYGHLARDSEESIRARLDARSASNWRLSGVRRRLTAVPRRPRSRMGAGIAADGACRARTGDPQLAKLVLSQLS